MVGKIQAEPKSLSNLVHLLESVKRSLDHQNEVENLRGDRFNIFSILRVESDENRLHSAFIAELLDAEGSHGMGALFLARFLIVLNAAGVKRELDIATTRVAVEKDIGRISADGTQGGRIDILLEDGAGSSVSIENKIYASDQNNQVVRYTRYNSMRNEVVYLTLLGQEPDDKSKGQLVAGEDFYCVSYREHITNWLSDCIQIAAEQPRLRETLRQYKSTIKGLSNQVDDQTKLAIDAELIKHFDSAAYIANRFDELISEKHWEFQNQLRDALEATYANQLSVAVEHPATDKKKHSNIWLTVDGFDKQSVQFGIENFGWHGHHDNCLFIGFRCPNGKVELFADTQDNMLVFNRNSRYKAWANTTYFDKDSEKFGSGSSRIRFTDPELVSDIYADEQQFESLLSIVLEQACKYIDDHLPALLNYLENSHQPS